MIHELGSDSGTPEDHRQTDYPPQFGADLARIVQAARYLTPDFTEQIPPTAKHSTNVSRHIFSTYRIMYENLEQQGYGIYFSDHAVATDGRPVPDSIRVSCEAEDEDIVDELTYYDAKNPYNAILHCVSADSIPSIGLNPWHPTYTDLRNQWRGIAEEEFTSLLPRVYMATLLRSELNDEFQLPQYRSTDLQTYEELRNKGLHPLGLEEIHGMVATVIVANKARLDYDTRPAAQRRAEEY